MKATADAIWRIIDGTLSRYEKKADGVVPGSVLRFDLVVRGGLNGWVCATTVGRFIHRGMLEIVSDAKVDGPGVTWRRSYRRGDQEPVIAKSSPVWRGGLDDVDTLEAQKRAKSKPFTWVRLPQRLGDKGMNELEELGFEVSQVIRWTGEGEDNLEIPE